MALTEKTTGEPEGFTNEETPPKVGKPIKFALFFVVIAILGVSAYYLYPLIGGEQEQPPSISISTNKFQGLLKKEDVCKLPGYEYTKAIVDAYKEPTDLAEDQKYELEGGDHLYHADEELSIKEILDLIVPVEGNKVIIAYYNPSYTTSDKPKGFHLYPKVEGTNEITDPSAFKIQPNQGFAILSCKDTKIWKVKNENYGGTGVLPSLIGNSVISNDWLLVSINKNIEELLTEDVKKAVTAVWWQKGPGFDFEEVGIDDLKGNYGGYYMAWFKVDKSIIENLPKETPDEEDMKEIIEDTMQDVTNPPDPSSTGADGADAQIETTGEAQIEKTLEEAVGGTSYGGQGPAFGGIGSLEEKQSDSSDAPTGSALNDMNEIESAVKSTLESESADAPKGGHPSTDKGAANPDYYNR